MTSGILRRLEDQPTPLNYAEASNSAGVSAPRIWKTKSQEAPKPIVTSSQNANRIGVITSKAMKEAIASMTGFFATSTKDEELVPSFRFGSETYHFYERSAVTYVQHEGKFSAVVKDLEELGFRGIGDSRETAKKNLFQQIHRQFQRLYKTQPMQRDDAQEALWQQLEKLIDADDYRRNRLSIVKCSGKIVSMNESGVVYHWHGCSEIYLPVDCLSGDWGTLNELDWCDAVLKRRARDGKIIEATMIGKIKPPTQISDEESAALWDSLPIAKLYPVD